MRELDFKPLIESDAGVEADAPPARSWRRSRRDANPTVQMSVRMREDVYERFRALCAHERRTNGDMLEVLLGVYEKASRSERTRAR